MSAPLSAHKQRLTMSYFCLEPTKDNFNQIAELEVCLAHAPYDAEAVLSNPAAFKADEISTLRDQIVSKLERAWEITGRSEDELTGVMVQISQVVAKEFRKKKCPLEISRQRGFLQTR